ncbi:MAG: hypothetical protein QOG15_1157 [Solirubrobacteraceae bacterium]|nr:hypothetical protein [Solirubrobacteraceae bacterium]
MRAVRCIRMLSIALCAAGLLAAPAASAATLVNGGFESGDLTGWTTSETSAGSSLWTVYSGAGPLPLSGNTVPGAIEGTYAAVTDQTNASTQILYQDVTLEPGIKHRLNFVVYYESQAPIAIPSPDTLDWTVAANNQQYRVDIMDPTAAVDSVAAGDVLAPVFQTQPASPLALPPTAQAFDLSPFAGQTVRIRFAAVSNSFYLQAHVDAVSITSDGTPPETTITGGPAAGSTIRDNTPTLTFASNEAGSTFVCRVDTGTTVACSSPLTTATLADGQHTVAVTAIDALGNVDPTTAARQFTVDAVLPTPGCTLTVAQVIGTSAKDALTGTSGHDVLHGLGGKDTLKGLGDGDCLYGGSGSDKLSGGPGADRLFGGGGADRLSGGSGKDRLTGNAGADRLTDRSGVDTFSGGAGNDRIDARDTSSAGKKKADRVRCGSGSKDRARIDKGVDKTSGCEIVTG